MDYLKIGNFIQQIRDENHLTQDEFGDKIGIGGKTISKWECGRSIPSFETMKVISEIFNVSLYELSIGERIKVKGINQERLIKLVYHKDVKKIKLKNYILAIAGVIFVLFSLCAFIYFFGNYNKGKIYSLYSLDDDYSLIGNYSIGHEYKSLLINNIRYSGENYEKYDEIVCSSNYSVYINGVVVLQHGGVIPNNNSCAGGGLSVNVLLSTYVIYAIDMGDSVYDLSSNPTSLKLSINYATHENKLQNLEINIGLKPEYQSNRIF